MKLKTVAIVITRKKIKYGEKKKKKKADGEFR